MDYRNPETLDGDFDCKPGQSLSSAFGIGPGELPRLNHVKCLIDGEKQDSFNNPHGFNAIWQKKVCFARNSYESTRKRASNAATIGIESPVLSQRAICAGNESNPGGARASVMPE